MVLNPAPTIEVNTLLVTQSLIRSDMARAAQMEFCLLCADSLLATYQDAVDDFQANFNAHWQANIDTQVTINPPTGRGGDGSNVPLLVVAAGAAVQGTNNVTTLPPNVSMLLKKSTPAGGRTNRGRTYFPFVLTQADVLENGTLVAGSRTTYSAAAAAFLAQLNADTTPMVIENKTFNQPLPPHYVTHIQGSAAQVSTYAVEAKIATQRRRLDR